MTDKDNFKKVGAAPLDLKDIQNAMKPATRSRSKK